MKKEFRCSDENGFKFAMYENKCGGEVELNKRRSQVMKGSECLEGKGEKSPISQLHFIIAKVLSKSIHI